MGIGIDSLEIARCAAWMGYSSERLLRIFSRDEITYAMSNPMKKVERLAARFAAKEAFCKALHAAYPNNRYSLFAVCKAVCVIHSSNGVPQMQVNWHALGHDNQRDVRIHLSLSHTKITAIAYVIIEKAITI